MSGRRSDVNAIYVLYDYRRSFGVDLYAIGG